MSDWTAEKAKALEAELLDDSVLNRRMVEMFAEVGGTRNLRRARVHRIESERLGRAAALIQQQRLLIESLMAEAAPATTEGE